MSLRVRFLTPATAKALLSWRILLGVGAAAALIVAGVSIPLAVVAGIVAYGISVYVAMPSPERMPRIDPFTLSEPWRQFVQGAQRAGNRLHDTVDKVADGPLRQRLDDIVARLDSGLADAWQIARRGDEIDEAVRRLDPTALRSKLALLEAQSTANPSDDVAAAVGSVERQLASADRLKELSQQTAGRLRLTQTRLDELVARASEVSVGALDTDTYGHDVDDLVVELESLRLAMEETRKA